MLESTIPVLDEFVDGKCVGFDTSLARNEGILVAINLDDANCETTYFVYFNSITGQLQNATIPVGNFYLELSNGWREQRPVGVFHEKGVVLELLFCCSKYVGHCESPTCGTIPG